MKTGARKQYLDIAKGIVMLWIVSVHADGNYYLGDLGSTFRIPMFFLIAGFLWKERDEPIPQQLKRRALPLLRSYFGYNALLLIPYLFDMRASLIPQTKYCIAQLLKHIFGIFWSEGVILKSDTTPSLHYFTSYNYAMWFLTAMVSASAVFLLMLFLRDRLHISLWLQMLPCILITVLLDFLPLRLPWSLNICFFFGAMIAFGHALRAADFFARKYPSPLIPLLLYGLAFSLTLFISIWNDGSSTSMLMTAFGIHGKWSIPVYFIGGMLGSVVFLRLCMLLERLKISRLFAYIGRNTIPILCLHLTFVVWYNRLWWALIDIDPAAGSGLFYLRSLTRLIFAAAGSLGAMYLGRFLKKHIPFLNRFFSGNGVIS